MRILVANIGSTSFKFQLFDIASKRSLAQGRVERIGQPGGDCPDYETAIDRCLATLVGPRKPLADLSELSAIGFKAVHAGPGPGLRFVDDELFSDMERFCFLAPAHNPPYIRAMRAFRDRHPKIPLVALFETAFFSMAEESRTYAVPFAWKEELGIQRYGFHGASHRYAAERAATLLGRTDLRQVSCHLGGSSSLAAIKDGAGIDSSFGMSPQSGLPHNNRVGEIDAFAVLYAMKQLGIGIDEMASILARESGLAGISGVGGDLRDLEAAGGNQRAKLALDVFVYWIRHYLGAFMLQLGGLDVLSFSGGIGENRAAIRRRVCTGLESFGLVVDPRLNRKISGELDIAALESKVRVLVIPANEEWIVARHAAELISSNTPGGGADETPRAPRGI
ncbi:MAG: acetate/propionate family kinase [Acidobacteria bacterium]|nr:MAG: acetate/propionate family kinase [Acidobacteriota bacterium]